MTLGDRTPSAADIVVPEPSRDGGGSTAFVGGLRGLKAACGEATNRHHVAIVLIKACIESGVDTRGPIIAALQAAGIKHDHAAVILREETGSRPDLHSWQRDADGRYRLL